MTSEEAVKNYAPAQWADLFEKLGGEDLRELIKDLEAVAERAAMMATYLEERHGYGCGDQGHASAVKACNRAARIVHCRALGYNAYKDLSF